MIRNNEQPECSMVSALGEGMWGVVVLRGEAPRGEWAGRWVWALTWVSKGRENFTSQ